MPRIMRGGWCQRGRRVSWTIFSSWFKHNRTSFGRRCIGKSSGDKFECRDARRANAAFFCALPTAAQAPRIGCVLAFKICSTFHQNCLESSCDPIEIRSTR